MSRKDFEMIANILRLELEGTRGNDEPHGTLAIEETARSFAGTFARAFPRFDSARFLKACTVTP